MRILLDYRSALRHRTGVGVYIHETAKALASTAGPDETLVLFSASWKDRLAPDVIRPLQVVDRRIPVRVLNLAWHRAGFPPAEWLAGRAFDVVHAAHPLLIPATGAARVVTIHDLDFLDHPERTRGEIKRDYAALAAAHAQKADQVIVVSSHTAQAVESRLGVPVDRITVCRPGAPDWSPRSGPPTDNPCILFIGTLEPRKNLDVLLDAYARMVAARSDTPPLILAGRIDASAASIVARATQPPLAGRVELPGYVTDEAKMALLARAAVLVLPSHTEGFGSTAVEAMRVGVPVVAANRGALPETVGPAGRLIDPDDASDLAHALATVVWSRDEQVRMAELGRAHAAEFTWVHTAARTREAWQLAVEHRAARRG